MLKVYEVAEKELKAAGWQGPMDRSINLKDVEFVRKPKEADLVLVHLSLRETHLSRPILFKLIRNLDVDERRVCAFDCSDHEEDYADTNPNCLFIRSNCKGWMKRRMPRTISWAWPVEDLIQCMPIPDGGHKYKIGFQGWIKSSNVRLNSITNVQEVLGNTHKMPLDIATYPDFYGYIEHTDEGRRRRKEFLRSLQECQMQLCPASIFHVFPYRFFEAMSAGRVPILFCTDYVLPWSDKIDWDSCTVRFPGEEAHNAGTLILEWFKNHSTGDIIAMGNKAREYWYKWLNRDKANDLFKVAIEEALIRDGLFNG